MTKKKLTDDTHGKRLFEEFGLNVIREKATPVSTFDEIKANFVENRFSAKVMTAIGEKNVCLEFPVNHINIKHETMQWQVETGPILMPNFEEKEAGDLELLPCFFHFNSFYKLDVFYDYPFGFRRSQTINKGIMQSIDCKIEILTNSTACGCV